MYFLIILLILAFSIWYVIVDERKHNIKAFILKVVSTSGSIFIARYLYFEMGQVNKFALFILIGLGFGILGDIVIFFDINLCFILGMVAFLIGHIFYMVAVIRGYSISGVMVVPCIILIVAIPLLMVLLKFNMGKPYMWIAVGVYCLVIIVLYSIVIDACINAPKSTVLGIGTTLFVFSDFVLAWGKFAEHKPVKWVSYIGSVSYFVGQGLIALSILYYG